MSDFTSDLKAWGSTGVEYPDGYKYVEGQQPVDAWDNNFRYTAIEEIKHLIDVTNSRIEADSGTNHPTSPETSHLSYRTDNERLYHYNSTQSSWNGLFKISGDKMEGNLDLGGNEIKNVGKLTLGGEADLSGNDITDSVNSATIYDSTAGVVPLNALEQSDVTVNTGSHISGGGNISLGGSINVSIDDDFLLNSGDSITGEFVSELSEDSRHFTAENTTDGNRFSVKSETDGDFILLGYDNASNSWEYSSALEYSPGNGIWTFRSTPTVDGDTIATQPWVEGNYSNINAETLDGSDGVDGQVLTTDGTNSNWENPKYPVRTSNPSNPDEGEAWIIN